MSIKTFKDVKVGDIVYFAKSFPDPSVEERTVCDVHDSILNGKICIVLNKIPNDNYSSIFDVKGDDEYYEGYHVMLCLDKASAVKFVDKDINPQIQLELKLLYEYVAKSQAFRNQYHDILY